MLGHEAENGRPLGLLPPLERNINQYGGGQPYFVLVQDASRIAAAAVMIPPRNVILALSHVEGAIEAVAEDLLGFEPRPPGVVGPAQESLAFAAAWQRLTGTSFRLNRSERLYRLDRVTSPIEVSGRIRRANEPDRQLLVEWINAFQLEALSVDNLDEARRTAESMLDSPPEVRGVFLWEDNEPVCLVGYGRPTLKGIAIAPVYTPPHFRRRGYASASTAAVSQHLLDSGREFCVLFTDLANPTSNKIYQEVGYRPLSDFSEYVFTSG